MKTMHIAAALIALAATAGSAFAADPTCATQAADKKLAGAAKTSFVKKCEKDAMAANPAFAACDKSAAEKKLAGAAKTSYTKKCVADAGAPAKAPAMAASGAKK